jgi:MerR family copper efflux transcriptional regulator
LTFNPGRSFIVTVMDGYSISQTAQRTGFPPSTLRFYEQSGLVNPDRTPSGYRSYDDHHLELLAFIGRAKGFGLSLEEITDVLSLLDQDRCAPVQDRLRDLVDAKILEAQDRIVELTAFTAELRQVSGSLGIHTPEGPCDDTCGCTSGGHDPGTSLNVELTAKPNDLPPIACTLAPDRVGDRLADWQATVAAAVDQHPIDGGVRFQFAATTDVAALAALAASEQDCCQFFTFTLTIDLTGVALDIIGPPDAQPVIQSLIGALA